MNAAPGSRLLRSRIAERLGALVLDQGARAIGRQVGVDGTTIGRWGTEVSNWGFNAVDLAIKDDELWASIVAYRNGDHSISGEAVRVTGDLFEVLTSCSELMGEVTAALKDGLVDKTEAGRLLQLLRRVLDVVTKRVIPDLEALRG